MRISGFVNLLLLVGLVLPAAAVAADWTDAEIKAMPPYCQARLQRGKDPAKHAYWAQILGPDFLHTHHFCYGLGAINRYYRARTPQEKKSHLDGAYGDLSYVVSRVSPTYSLMPDVYLNRGLVLSLLGNYGGAINDLKKAIELNPKLARAYTLASDIHAKLNQKSEALKVVADGLRHVPDSSALQRLYRERGGKLPYPEPIAPAASAPAVPAPTRQEGETAEKDGKSQDALTQTPASPAPEAAGSGGAQVQAPAAPKIGSPTNPWCRFCPDPAQ